LIRSIAWAHRKHWKPPGRVGFAGRSSGSKGKVPNRKGTHVPLNLAIRLRSQVDSSHALTTVLRPKGNEMAPSQPNKADSLTVRGGFLLVLLLLNGFGAIAGGIAVMRDAMPFPDVWLQGTPFRSYFLPGLILFVAVGGSHLTSGYAIFRRHPLAKRAAIFAGIVLTGWMIGELELIGFQAPIQVWFVGVGLFEFGLSFAPLRHS
jgi:hypothetical protein